MTGQYTIKRNPIRRKPVVDHDADTVTFAVTFRWRRPWAMDHCEVGVLGGELRRALVAKFADWEQLAGLESVETWEPNEERHIGRGRPVHFPDPEIARRQVRRRDELAAEGHSIGAAWTQAQAEHPSPGCNP